jgi:hypothetical protein
MCLHMPHKIQCWLYGLVLINKWWSSQYKDLISVDTGTGVYRIEALDKHLTDQNEQYYSRNCVGVNHCFIQLVKSDKMSS